MLAEVVVPEAVDYLVSLVEEARGLLAMVNMAEATTPAAVAFKDAAIAWLEKSAGIYSLDEKNERTPVSQCSLCGGNARKCGCPR